jgi:hypothetical protein
MNMREIVLGAGGFINQVIHSDKYDSKSWDADNRILLPVRLFDATSFEPIFGIDPPSTPITAQTYAEHGYLFFKLHEQPSGIYGDLNLKSVGALDKKAGIHATVHEDEKSLSFPCVDIAGNGTSAVKLNEVGDKPEFIPFEKPAIRR